MVKKQQELAVAGRSGHRWTLDIFTEGNLNPRGSDENFAGSMGQRRVEKTLNGRVVQNARCRERHQTQYD